IIGSGPYKFVPGEFVPGQRSVYLKNTDYVPRSEPANVLAGGKIAHIDRVEWRSLDPTTATAALITGEVDFLQSVGVDVIPVLKKEKSVQVVEYDPEGLTNIVRFNVLHPPFNNKRLRQIVLEAMDQDDVN
ncbi:ABC transporter substrate-binding protein, partial [Corallococcus praedator]|uniref:ABC transporter substrate-binding protein n=1 Tax=Corallococcus praedator TaxID=2316724 RepID=UPI001ABF1AE9